MLLAWTLYYSKTGETNEGNLEGERNDRRHSMKYKMKKSIWVLLPAVLSLLTSCATTPKIKSPPEEFKANLGTIGVVSASFQPEVQLNKPMGKGDAAWHYAGKGALFAAEAAGRGCYGVGCAGFIVAMPLGALVGSIVGLAKGLPSNEIKQSEKTLKSHLDTVNFQETMRERFLTVARKETQSRLVPLEVEGPKTPNEELTYVSLSESGIDTVLEISVRKYEFSTVSQHRGINPYLYLSLVAGIKFIRVADGKVL
jgi:hypothetical protein